MAELASGGRFNGDVTSSASARPRHSNTGNSTASRGLKWAMMRSRACSTLQHVFMPVAVVATAMVSIVAVVVVVTPVRVLPVVVDTLVVPVAVGVVGVRFSRVGVGSHGNHVRSRGDRRLAANNRTTLVPTGQSPGVRLVTVQTW